MISARAAAPIVELPAGLSDRMDVMVKAGAVVVLFFVGAIAWLYLGNRKSKRRR